MKIFLVRHPMYNPKTVDPNEGISEEGRESVYRLKSYLDKKELKPDVVYCSTKTRAKESAEILKGDAPLVSTEMLNPLSAKEPILSEINKLYSNNFKNSDSSSCLSINGSIMLVGHLPLLRDISNFFGYDIDFDMASCALIDDGKLVWYVTQNTPDLY